MQPARPPLDRQSLLVACVGACVGAAVPLALAAQSYSTHGFTGRTGAILIAGLATTAAAVLMAGRFRRESGSRGRGCGHLTGGSLEPHSGQGAAGSSVPRS